MPVGRITWRYAFSRQNRHRVTAVLLAFGICCAMTALVLVLAFMDQLQMMRFDDIKILDSYSLHVVPDDTSRDGAMNALSMLSEIEGVTKGILFSEIPAIAYTGDGGGRLMRIRALDEMGFAYTQNGKSMEIYAGAQPAADASIPEILVSWEQLQNVAMGGTQVMRVTVLARGRTSAAVPRDFTVRPSGIFSSALPEFNSSVMFMSLESLLALVPSSSVRIGLVVDETKVTSQAMASSIRALHPSWQVMTWQEQYASLYGAMMLEKGMMTIMIGFLMLVMAFMLLHASRRLLRDKQRELAMLEVIGFGRSSLLTISVLQSLCVAACGLIGGFLLSHVLALTFPSLLSGIATLSRGLTGYAPAILTLPLILKVDVVFYAFFSCAVLGVISLFSFLAARKLISRNIMESILHDTF
ncbi:ABC transporter permease [Parasphaerochaeta coccoides]|uniref:ABC3 transporter permease C-terminal domain-containing protein n=1 Tax=Parasphaerochaeta coccoides (strain ATCC BAA-1237 / DSM 17374 / SPN1) TaxID=760011 RepID=F4GJC8_PARC1|nr:protein of unknown function DUF214 [Parasphaerochaeta coccoides DSM 17374]